ncbi:unnamed protein product, partial [Prorocentrum cordatum]
GPRRGGLSARGAGGAARGFEAEVREQLAVHSRALLVLQRRVQRAAGDGDPSPEPQQPGACGAPRGAAARAAAASVEDLGAWLQEKHSPERPREALRGQIEGKGNAEERLGRLDARVSRLEAHVDTLLGSVLQERGQSRRLLEEAGDSARQLQALLSERTAELESARVSLRQEAESQRLLQETLEEQIKKKKGAAVFQEQESPTATSRHQALLLSEERSRRRSAHGASVEAPPRRWPYPKSAVSSSSPSLRAGGGGCRGESPCASPWPRCASLEEWWASPGRGARPGALPAAAQPAAAPERSGARS